MELAAAARHTACGGYVGAQHGAIAQHGAYTYAQLVASAQHGVYAGAQHAFSGVDLVHPYLYGAHHGVSTLLQAAHHGANSAHLATAYGAQNGAAQPVAACAAPVAACAAPYVRPSAPPQSQGGAVEGWTDGRLDGSTGASELRSCALVSPSAFPLCQGVIGPSLCSGDLGAHSGASGWGGAGLGGAGLSHPNLGFDPNLGLGARLSPEYLGRISPDLGRIAPDLRRTSAGAPSVSGAVAGAVSGALANGGIGGLSGALAGGLAAAAGHRGSFGTRHRGNGTLGTLGRSLSARDLGARDLGARDLSAWNHSVSSAVAGSAHSPNMGASPTRLRTALSSGCLSSALGGGAGGGSSGSGGRESPRSHLPYMDRDHSPYMDHTRGGVVLGGVGGTDRHDRYDRYDVGRVSVDYGSHHRSDPPPLLSGSFSSAGVGATSHGGSVLGGSVLGGGSMGGGVRGGSVPGGGSMGGGGAYSGDSGFDGCVAMMVAASEASAREEEAQMRQQEAEACLSASAAHQQLEHETARDGALGRPSAASAVASAAPHAAAPRAAAEADEAAAAAETEMAAAALMMSSSRRHADADDECDEGEGGDYGSEDGAHDGDEDADDSAYDGASSGGSRRRRRDVERDGEQRRDEQHVIIPYQPRSSSILYEEACEALSSELIDLEAQIRELQSMQTARLKRDARLLEELTVGVQAKLMRTQHGHAPGMAPELGYGGAQHGAQMPLGLSPPPLPRVATNGRPSYGNRSAHHGAWR